MNEFSIEIPTLITATLTMSLSAIMAMFALHWLKPSGHRIYRIVWFAVLINGIILARYSVELPVLDMQSSTSLASIFGQYPNTETDFLLDKSASFENSTEISHLENRGPHAMVAAKSDLATDVATARPTMPPTAVFVTVNWTGVLGYIWLTGVGICLFWLVFQYAAFLRLASSARPAQKQWQHHCDDTCRAAGLSRPLPLYVHNDLGPALYLTARGYRIVVPEKLWRELNLVQRSAIIRHEVEHCRRCDVLTSLFAFIVASIHWFNPVAWIAVRHLNQAAEWACDDAAITDTDHQSVFARALLSISTSNSKHLIGVHGVGNSNLKQRIHRLLTKNTEQKLHRVWAKSLCHCWPP